NEFDNRFESIHKTRRHETVLTHIPPDCERHDQKHRRCDKPKHQYMFGDGKINAEYRGQLDQRMLMAAVGDVLNDRFARIEFLDFCSGMFLNCPGRMLLDYDES